MFVENLLSPGIWQGPISKFIYLTQRQIIGCDDSSDIVMLIPPTEQLF
jgi:hypothetical protein